MLFKSETTEKTLMKDSYDFSLYSKTTVSWLNSDYFVIQVRTQTFITSWGPIQLDFKTIL